MTTIHHSSHFGRLLTGLCPAIGLFVAFPVPAGSLDASGSNS